ncbi:hypothetical protein HanRHA438_Chr01g0019261 [Helianthus annuus]|uniref:Uncharacterized protein n=1 Tax=Helianthus annuus TaxID=4232 RepID=A0A9K3JWC0_HELAN|nr:hypothetical protein HanXRQr2_Chr01g0018781 [Helianthus annuus]KAJ0611396.1 hypothetical protein HanHA300_Chr01g0015151 [Helianthus annuus]KAJ0622436.1 hypothetical protein HanIR_Chr01g0020501 [Helianthus annuus]KAJ0626695.1 hypothetical protein HanHA89_Chr01g0016771 [Helianthus annuus]KAJ0947741.1 hypothetical protein HanRHA438_Chr01g0019261 [Helianthus annuus]
MRLKLHCSRRKCGRPWHPCEIQNQERIPDITVCRVDDLRDDKQFLTDHPGAVPITMAQGEELKKLIGVPAYIECS